MINLEKFKKMKKKQQLGLVVITASLLATFYTMWPSITILPIPLAGSYYTKNELEISTIIITEKEPGQINCVWDKQTINPKGEVHENRIVLDGTVKGKDIELATTLQSTKPIVVSAVGLREGKDIRMSLSSDGRLFYAGFYEPTDSLSMVAATSEFKRKASELALAWSSKLQLRVTGGKTKSEQIVLRKRMVDQANQYTRKIHDFIGGRAKVEGDFKNYTLQMKQNLDNAQRMAGQPNSIYRKQLIIMMHNIQELTRNLEDQQNNFKADYVKQIVPYFNSLSTEQKVCTDAKALGKSDPVEEELCALAYQIQTSMMGQVKELKPVIVEIDAIYKAESNTQQDMIDQAERIQ